MNQKYLPVYFFLVIGLTFTSCGLKGINSSSLEEGDEVREATLTFDGESCFYEGPGRITEGKFAISLISNSELEAEWWVYGIDDGKTWEEMVEYISPPGSVMIPPDWSTNVIKSTDPDNPNVRIFEFKPGLYAINCCTCQEIDGTIGVWPGAPLEVVEED